MNDLQILNPNDSLQHVIRAEMESQVDIAKRWPRDLPTVLSKIKAMATIDIETAEDCFYALQRGRGEDAILIEGLSVRFAEIIASCWGNLRIGTRTVGNDGKKITVQGVCHDLESNLFVSKEVDRRITTKTGQTFSEDMQVVTTNAAQAIAFRNVVLAVIPKAITRKIVDEVKQIAIGQTLDIEKKRNNAIAYYKTLGVSEQELLNHLGISSINEIDNEKVVYLSGLKNAIKEGTTTVYDTFRREKEEKIETAKTKPTGNTMAAMNSLKKSDKVLSENVSIQSENKKTDKETEDKPNTEQASEITFPEVEELNKAGARSGKNSTAITTFLKDHFSPESFEQAIKDNDLGDYAGMMDFALRAPREDVNILFSTLL